MRKHTILYLIAFSVLSFTFLGCKKYAVRSLGAKPVASFTVTPVSGQVNKYLLSSTSQNAFRYDWDKADGGGDGVSGEGGPASGPPPEASPYSSVVRSQMIVS